MEQIVVQPPPLHPQAAQYAGFWRRLVAYIIDKIILSALSAILIVPFLLMIGLSALSSQEFDSSPSIGLLLPLIGAYFVVIILVVIGEWLYFALMESKKGATLGKMVMGIYVTDLEGNSISFGRATGRYFGKILSGLILLVGYMMAGWTQQKQALHDILAGCLVFTKR